uniref:protein unc-93 homolog A-like isoform X2 n=1 Tax=Ciona intestinalis TaxID=7719 RepID=UPI00089DD4BB|nr:protein unc-93 homolog A-like isoform X2 [Ciona intestinalis]|eukprot:XP_018672243.1 protein unc-93 homolog A-like isoform X2 [Ciona intestinalis]
MSIKCLAQVHIHRTVLVSPSSIKRRTLWFSMPAPKPLSHGTLHLSYNILVGGFVQGLSEALAWTVMPLFTFHYAKKHFTKGSKTNEEYANHYMGYFFAAVEASMISGNAIGFLIFHIDRSVHPSNVTAEHAVDFKLCGINDCQLPNATEQNLSQYTPTQSMFLYIAIGTFAFIQLVAIILHALYLPKDLKPSQPDKANNDTLIQVVNLNENEEMEISNNSVKLKTSVITTLKLCVHPKHILISLLTIYNGMTLAFIMTELTRAYASCFFGLDKVSLCSMIFGAADAFSAVITGKLVAKIGRNILFLVAFLIDVVCYVLCLLELPNEHNQWLVYFLFFCLGASDGVWQPLIMAMYGEYFPKQTIIACNLWNVVINVGYTFQFAISTSLCVHSKIYIQLGVLVVGLVGYYASQLLYYKGSK